MTDGHFSEGALTLDMRERHIGGITTRLPPDGSELEVDVGALVRRLILFEHCVLESDYLKEIPYLVAAFGYKGLRSLLSSGALSIICDYFAAGSVGQISDLKVTALRGGPLPLSSYRIVPISVPDQLENGRPYRPQYVYDALKSVNDSPGLSEKEKRRLKIILEKQIEAYPRSIVNDSAATFRQVITAEDPSIQRSLEVAFRAAYDRELPAGVALHTEDLGNDGDFRVSTDLAKRPGLDAEDAHKVMERALLGAASVDQRVHIMHAFDCVSGFKDEEMPVFEGRLTRFWSELDPQVQEGRLRRVTSIGGYRARQSSCTSANRHRQASEAQRFRRVPGASKMAASDRQRDRRTDR